LTSLSHFTLFSNYFRYLTSTEWVTLYGGKAAGPSSSADELKFRRLPFDFCCLTLQPVDTPYSDQDGNIFELEPIIAFIKKFKKNPVTGKTLEAKDLFKVTFHKNAEGKYHCPVLFKTLTKQSHIVVVKSTSNVFSYEAVEQLNIKTKNWRDLLNSEPFERKDLITLQDPNNINKFNIAEFYHIKNDLKLVEDAEKDHATLKNVNNETKAILEELNETYKAPEQPKTEKKQLDQFNSVSVPYDTIQKLPLGMCYKQISKLYNMPFLPISGSLLNWQSCSKLHIYCNGTRDGS